MTHPEIPDKVQDVASAATETTDKSIEPLANDNEVLVLYVERGPPTAVPHPFPEGFTKFERNPFVVGQRLKVHGKNCVVVATGEQPER